MVSRHSRLGAINASGSSSNGRRDLGYDIYDYDSDTFNSLLQQVYWQQNNNTLVSDVTIKPKLNNKRSEDNHLAITYKINGITTSDIQVLLYSDMRVSAASTLPKPHLGTNTTLQSREFCNQGSSCHIGLGDLWNWAIGVDVCKFEGFTDTPYGGDWMDPILGALINSNPWTTRYSKLYRQQGGSYGWDMSIRLYAFEVWDSFYWSKCDTGR